MQNHLNTVMNECSIIKTAYFYVLVQQTLYRSGIFTLGVENGFQFWACIHNTSINVLCTIYHLNKHLPAKSFKSMV